MRHDWIFDVLEDLRTYALQNGLQATAAKAEEALIIARTEVAAGEETPPLVLGHHGGSGRPN